MPNVRALAPVAALAFAFASAGGLAWVLLPSSRRDRLTLAVTTLGLSLGSLTLIMFWVALLWPGRLNLLSSVAPGALLGGVGLWLASKNRLHAGAAASNPRDTVPRNPLTFVCSGAIVLVLIGVLFNASYWPFADVDALVIYAPLGKRIFETGSLPVGSLYEGYPMLVPLAYAYTHWAAFGVNEYAARLVPAIMALGAVGAAGALGREVRSSRAGLWAAGLIVLTPLFGRWASSGYVDVPASLYFTLTALAAWRWLRKQAWQDALLAGVFCGLGAWTKSNALTLIVSLLVLIGYRWWLGRRPGMARVRWPQVALMMAAFLGVAGPWHARNLVMIGSLLPHTVWTGLARRDLGSLLVMIRDRQHFQASGWLFSSSLLYGGARAATESRRTLSAWVVLLVVLLPFLLAWWWWASYDVRFLVTVVPVMGVLAGSMLEEVIDRLGARLTPAARDRAAWAGALVVLILIPFALQKTVEGKWAILRNPLMTDTEKHHERLGGAYDLALEINRLPEGGRIVGVPPTSLYHILTDRFAELSQAVPDRPPWELGAVFDYAVYNLPGRERPGWFEAATPLLQTDDGFYLYSTHSAGPT